MQRHYCMPVKNMSKLTLVRGLPGSGKSTFAKLLNVFHVEADMWFMKNSNYEWTREDLGKAHKWCQEMVEFAMIEGMDIVVSNTFVKVKDIKPYIKLAETYNYNFEVIECKADYGSIHVGRDIIDKMKSQWEEYNGPD